MYVAPEELSSVRASLTDAKNAALSLVALFRAELVPRLDPVLADERALLDLGLPMPVTVNLHCLNRNGEAHHIATAAKRWNPDRAHASPDPALRREALRQRSGAAPASLICDVLVSTRTPALQRIETSRAPGDLLAVIRAFRFMLNAVDAGIFPPAPPESWICSPRWCPYFYSCSHVPARRKILPVGVHGREGPPALASFRRPRGPRSNHSTRSRVELSHDHLSRSFPRFRSAPASSVFRGAGPRRGGIPKRPARRLFPAPR